MLHPLMGLDSICVILNLISECPQHAQCVLLPGCYQLRQRYRSFQEIYYIMI